MQPPREMDDGHLDRRSALRVLGVLVLVTGVIFALVGFISFFSAFNGGGMPRLFWCAFVGLPLAGIGAAICKFAFLGAATRFVANEVAPVGKDVVDYLATGTKDAVRQVASAAAGGLRTVGTTKQVHVLRCHKCNADSEAPASFCKACGASLGKSRPCTACGEMNDPDARFCDNCGKPVAAA